MSLIHITDLGSGWVQVAWQRENAIPRMYPHPIRFAGPLAPEDRRELRWYLEDYLGFPYGAERERAAAVEKRMAAWGESLFEQVFAKGGTDPDPRAFYQEAVREGLERCEICVSSEDPDFLNIPWELLRDPTPGRGFLAPSLSGLFRQRSGQKIEAVSEVSPEEPFRILLVIARPGGASDILLGTVARPVLEAVRPLRPRVQLDVLRPPTFDALVACLNQRRGYYSLVHFDGHGVFAGGPRGPAMQYGAEAGRGRLVFETEEGGPHVVNSQELGEALATCRVPLFVLNACQSAEEGPADPFSSVAAQLVAVGARGVVAMSYSVYAATAALFMGRFYERLAAGASLSEAVAAARQRLYASPERPSAVGPLELRDWPVPALYQQEIRYTPIPATAGLATPDVEAPSEPVLRRRAEEVCPEGRFGFIGRDYDLLRIERALRRDDAPWALLAGLGGTGKTELAYGFARWYAETGGCPGGVFAASFREKAGFSQVIGSIAGYGTDFSLLSPEQQWDTLVGYLRENACLLVWDNFETVAGYPAGTEPLAPAEEREVLARFLQALRGGKSRVIITTRKPDEAWTGIAYELIEVSGLREWDAAALAEQILRTVGRAPRDFRDDPDYSRLLRLLAGHPRSLELVLPRLRYESPSEIIHVLQHRVDAAGDVLDASLAYAFERLSARARAHLPLLGLFTSCVRLDAVTAFVSSGDEHEAAYREVVGEALDAAGWRGVFDEAAGAGFLRPVGGPFYVIHPTLPAFLRRPLAATACEEGLKRLDVEFMGFYAELAAAVFEAVCEGERGAVAAAAVEEANLLRALRLAEMAGAWEQVHDISATLSELYELQGRSEEWTSLRGGLLRWIGREMSPGSERARAGLWMFLLGEEAHQALDRNDLDTAEAAYRQILAYLGSQSDPDLEPMIAAVYYQLGRIAEEREQLDGAEAWYRRAVEILERLGLERDAATDYHRLGIIAQKRGQLDPAEAWYRRALEIFERLGLERDAAADYHQLGMIAEERGELDRAEAWTRQALEIEERLGLERDAATEYHQLGTIAGERGQLDPAEAWHREALAINERLGLERYSAANYHHLGMMAEERGQLDRAERWHRRALEIRERLGLERDAATDYHQLGIIAEDRGELDPAERWYRKALEVFERLGLERDAAPEYHQLGIIAEERGQLNQAEAWYRRALEIYERLGLERFAADEYHELGRIAEERGQLGPAEAWYHRALQIYERLGHPLRVITLWQMGVLRRRQDRPREAVGWLGRALAIAQQYQMRVAQPILENLALMLEAMGEAEFTAAWRQELGDAEPPLDALRDIVGRMNAQE
jgi:tetratricopeptide (TPR) repeat protein